MIPLWQVFYIYMTPFPVTEDVQYVFTSDGVTFDIEHALSNSLNYQYNLILVIKNS